jgi:lipopolysaccharide/colanic/teichoic acid biosynthesis glycosyltransferase
VQGSLLSSGHRGSSWPRPITELERADRAGYLVIKRILDLVVAMLAILILSPLLIAIAVAIKLDSRGPVIFAQERVRGRRSRGRGGWVWQIEPFTLYKFRTMTAHADHAIHMDYMSAYLSGDEKRLRALRPGRREGDSYRPANDPRVTRVGSLLRKLSLDELPQLWNVLRGDMSLVGPRPPLPYEITMYEERHLRRLASCPGLTGWAQICGRTSIGFEDVVRRDLEYIARRSIWFDLKILLLTIPVVVSGKGAD